MEVRLSKGLIEYSSALEEMNSRIESIISKEKDELLWFLEHVHVYTAGTDSLDSELISHTAVPVVNIGRGGKYTYHGPGQRVVYVMLDLNMRNARDITKFIFNLEEWIIRTIDHFGIKGFRIDGAHGVWVKHGNASKKIAALGVRIKKWVTFHGIALNINTDLDYYKNISPCGFSSNSATSFADLKIRANLSDVDKVLLKEFSNIF